MTNTKTPIKDIAAECIAALRSMPTHTAEDVGVLARVDELFRAGSHQAARNSLSHALGRTSPTSEGNPLLGHNESEDYYERADRLASLAWVLDYLLLAENILAGEEYRVKRGRRNFDAAVRRAMGVQS